MELFDYEIEIKLNTEVIHPRENISGYVRIKVETALFLTHAYIEITGEAMCNWKEAKSKLFNYKTSYKGQQVFFQCRHTLAGNDGTEVIMEKKSYFYPFKCKLPGHLPATWKGDHGDIKYTAQVIIKSDDQLIGAHTKEITILPYRNLSYEPHLLIEAKRSVQRTFRFGFINLGQVTVTLWLPVCGIAIGQHLPVVCTVNNQSSVLFGGIIFVLTQIQVYRSTMPSYKIKTGVQEFYCVLRADGTLLPTTQYWRCSTCQMIYEVWVQLQGSLPKHNAYGYPNVDLPGIPVIVGTHPLCEWNINEVNDQVMKTLLRMKEPIVMDPPPPDEVVEEILNTVDDEFDVEMMTNLTRQLTANQNQQKKKA